LTDRHSESCDQLGEGCRVHWVRKVVRSESRRGREGDRGGLRVDVERRAEDKGIERMRTRSLLYSTTINGRDNETAGLRSEI
jgi:hypothetical protein